MSIYKRQSLSVAECLMLYTAKHIVESARYDNNQILVDNLDKTFTIAVRTVKGKDDELFQPLLTILSNEDYTADMKITRINVMKHILYKRNRL